MSKVFGNAQVLGESILASEEFTGMKAAEAAVTADAEAVGLIAALSEKRKAVETLLSAAQPSPEAIAAAGDELKAAEAAVNENEKVVAMQEARQHFTEMMNTVNQIIKFVVTGQIKEENEGCTGACANCKGCNH